MNGSFRSRTGEPGEIGALIATVGAGAALASVVIVAGPRAALLGCLAMAALTVLLARTEWTVGAYVLINLLAVSNTTLGGGFSAASVAGPARSIALAALILRAAYLVVRRDVPTGAILGPILPLIAVIGLSLVASTSLPSRAIDALPISGLIAALAIVTWSLVRDHATASRTLVAIAVAYGLTLVLNIALLPISSRPAFLGGRFEGILENPNSVGALGFALPVLIFAALAQRPHSGRRWLFAGLSVVLVLEVFMSVSRAGMLGMLASGAVMFVELTRRKLGIRVLAVVVTLGATLLLVLSGLTGRLSVDLRLATLSGGSGRSAAWSWALHQIAHRPALGYGYGSSPDLFAQYSLQNSLSVHRAGFVGSYSGNLFIDLGLELGLAGVVAFLIAYIIALRRMRIIPSAGPVRPGHLIGSVCLAMLIGGLIDAQGESFVMAPGGVVTVAFWFALLACSSFGFGNLAGLDRSDH